MRFFNSKAIPVQYEDIIYKAADKIRSVCPKDYEKIFKIILEAESREAATSEIHNSYSKGLLDVAHALYSCSHGELKSLCVAYNINQGHLIYANENNVFEVVKTIALEAMDITEPQEAEIIGDAGITDSN